MNPLRPLFLIKSVMTLSDKLFWIVWIVLNDNVFLQTRCGSFAVWLLALIAGKNICLCQKLDVERCQLWLEINPRQWAGDAAPLSELLFSKIFGRFVRIHSTDMLTNACQNTGSHFHAEKSNWDLKAHKCWFDWWHQRGWHPGPHVLSRRKKWQMIKRAKLQYFSIMIFLNVIPQIAPKRVLFAKCCMCQKRWLMEKTNNNLCHFLPLKYCWFFTT